MFSDPPTFQSSALEYPSYLSLQSIVHWTCFLLSPKQVSKLWASFPCLIWEGIQPFSLHLPSAPCWNKPKQENCSWLTNYFKSFPFISFTNEVSIQVLSDLTIIIYYGTMGLIQDHCLPHPTGLLRYPFFHPCFLHVISLCQAKCFHLLWDLTSIFICNIRKTIKPFDNHSKYGYTGIR